MDTAKNTDSPGYALVFPGQGSQHTEMAEVLLQDYPSLAEVYERASIALGYDLLQKISDPEELQQTAITQPAMLCTSIACWEALQSEVKFQSLQQRGRLVAVAGHSLGEYSALVCAGSLSLEDAVRLVAARGECMQAALPAGQGIMAAVLGMEDAQVESLCQTISSGGSTVELANYNAPGQVVVAGDGDGVKQLLTRCREQGAKVLSLPVSVPSHCSLMRTAAQQFAEILDTVLLADTVVPIIQNLDAVARTESTAIKPALLAQLYQSVQWVQSMYTLEKMAARLVIECGPGQVLCGLLRRTLSDTMALPMHKYKHVAAIVQQLHTILTE